MNMPDANSTQQRIAAQTQAFKVAAVQMASGPNVAGNLKEANRLIEMAAVQGARLVVLPEYFPIIGMKDTDKIAVREQAGIGMIQSFLSETARRHKIWLVGGSIPLASEAPDKVRSAEIVDRMVTYKVFALIALYGGHPPERNAEEYKDDMVREWDDLKRQIMKHRLIIPYDGDEDDQVSLAEQRGVSVVVLRR